MKNLISLFLVFVTVAMFTVVKGQSWSTGTSKLYANPTSTNVGIGTSSPLAKLHVNAGSGQDGLRLQLNGSTRLWLNSNGGLSVGNFATPPARGLYVYGNVGIGLTSSSRKLDVNGDIQAKNLYVVNTATTDWGYAFYISVKNDNTKAFTLKDKNNTEVFYIWGNGAVNAKQIYAEAFQVRPDAMGIYWYDHVFNNDYSLMELSDVENFIKNNQHLPDIPSESQINKEGFNLAEMDGLLLKKIEELTLYMIEQQKEIDSLKATINQTNQ